MDAAGPQSPVEPEALAAALCRGERRALAAALNLLDDRRPAAVESARRLLGALPGARLYGERHLIGLTGPPGAGKSSLASALIEQWRGRGLRVGVLAVDPSSPSSGGALLGDRLRMQRGGRDPGLFIRSLASRSQHGGLSAEVWPMAQVLLAACEIVLVETVGVGQTEVDVAALADTTCFVVQPASGDTIQFMKAGVLEVPHVLAVNKADLGAAATQAARELARTLTRTAEDGWSVPVLLVSARTGAGTAELAGALDAHRAHLAASRALPAVRRGQQIAWALRQLREDFGRCGLELLSGEARIREDWPLPGKSLAGAIEHYHRLRAPLLERVAAPLCSPGG
jgi:LAO/AO transport system kinase